MGGVGRPRLGDGVGPFKSRMQTPGRWARPIRVMGLLAIILGCSAPPGIPHQPAQPDYPYDRAMSPPDPASSLLTEGSPAGILLPGDLLSISVFGHPDLETQVRIPPEGILQVPLLDPMEAAGRTVPQLTRSLREADEEDFLTKADVSVSVVEFTPRRVYILGAVKKVGAYEIPVGKRLNLFQLLSLAGGFADMADRQNLVIIRKDGEREVVQRVDYRGMVRSAGRGEETLFLWPDDTVIVRQEQRVYVFGRVNDPGAFPLGEGGLTVIQAVSLAGGFQRIASPNRTIVIRRSSGGDRETFRVPVYTIVDEEDRRDFPLQGGDIVYVPEGIF